MQQIAARRRVSINSQLTNIHERKDSPYKQVVESTTAHFLQIRPIMRAFYSTKTRRQTVTSAITGEVAHAARRSRPAPVASNTPSSKDSDCIRCIPVRAPLGLTSCRCGSPFPPPGAETPLYRLCASFLLPSGSLFSFEFPCPSNRGSFSLLAILEPELPFFIDGRHQMSRRDRFTLSLSVGVAFSVKQNIPESLIRPCSPKQSLVFSLS